MLDKTKLGARYVCYQCATKFYDLNRPVASCPECGADQAEAPARDIKSILSSKGRARTPAPVEPEPVADAATDDDEDADEEEGDSTVKPLDDLD